MKKSNKLLILALVLSMIFAIIGSFGLTVSAASGNYTLVTDVSQLSAGDQVVIVAKDSNYALSTTQNSNNRGQASVTKSGNTVTLGSNVQVLELESGTVSGTFAFNTGAGYLYAASSSKNYLRTETTLSGNSSWKITIAADGTATVVAQGNNTKNTMQYNKSSGLFSAYSTAQQKICIYKVEASTCAHTNKTTTTVPATCTTAGSVTVTCDDCGGTVNTEVIEALGHNFVNRVCTNEGCNEAQPASIAGRYYIAAIRTSGNYFYMTSDLGTASTKRYQAVDSGLTVLPTQITSSSAEYVFVLVENDDATYSIYAEGVDGNNYLGWTSGNSGALVAESNAKKFTIERQEDGTYHIFFDTRYLSLNGTANNDYFAFYTGTQKQDLSLIPVSGSSCEHTNTTTTTVDATCTASGSITVTCDDCGETVSTETIDALGHTEEVVPGKAATCTETGLKDGKKCSVCGETILAQEEIAALGHTEEVVPGKAATCTETGLKDGKQCSVCGETLLAQEEIAALGHTEEVVPGKAATCTETGLTEGKKCSVCGEIMVAQEEIPAGHNFVNGTCTGCNSIIIYFENNWSWPDASVYYWTSGGNNGWPGSKLDAKDIVGQNDYGADIYKIIIPANVIGVIFNGTGGYGFEQSANITGNSIGICKCYYMTYDEATNTKPAGSYDYHKYSAWTEGADADKHEKVCTECNTVFTAAHTYTNSCDTECNDCGAIREIEHVYDNACDASCNVCGAERATDHTPAEAVKEDVVNATCSAEGSYNLVVRCSVCGEKISSEAKTEAKLDHTPAEAVEENRTESTCTVAGSYDSVVYCSVCSNELSRTKVDLPLADHNYVGGKCSACGDTDPDAVYVAQVGSEKFVSLQEAFDAAVSGDTITLLADTKVSKYIDVKTENNGEIARTLDLDLNGHTISPAEGYNYNTGYPLVFVGINQTLTIKGEGTITADKKVTVGVYGILTVTSGNIVNNGTTDKDAALAIFYWNNDLPSYEGIVGGTAFVTGGSFVGDVYCDEPDEDGKATLEISGGSFTTDVSDFCAESYTAVESEGVYTVVEAIAKIGTTKFASLEAAFAAAVSGDEIVLLSDIEIASALADAGKGYFNIADGVNITLDLNGKTIDVTDNSTGNFIVFYNYGEFTIKNGTVNLTATNNRAWNAQSTILLNRGGVANVVSGTYTHNGGTDMAFALDNSGNWYGDATMNITGGTITSTYTAIRNRMEQNSHGASGEAILNISGGEISGTTSAIWAQAASTSTTSPATGEINVSGGTVGNINTARSEGAVSMTTISGGTVAGFKGEVGELTVNGGTLTGDVTILTAAGEAADYAVNADGVYVSAVAKIGEVNYATLLDALLAAAESDSASEIKLLQSVREKMPTDIELIVNADLLITADSAVTAQFYNEGTNYDFIFNSNNNNTITIGENVTFQLEDRVIWLGYYGNNVDVVVDGTLAGYQIWHGADTTVSATGTLKTTGEALILRRGATLTVDGGKIEANYFNILSGHIFAENATIDCGAFWIANTGSYPNESNVNISIWNSTMTSSGNLKSASDHSAGVNIDVYDSVVSFVDFDGYGASQISNNTTLEVNGENAALTIKSLNNNGVIDVYDSASFTVTGAATNNGTITLEAGSSIEGPENMGVITGSNGYEIVYENGKYTAKTIDYVAAINGVNYETLAEALAEAKDGDVITLYWAEGDDPIAMNGAVFGKTVTITGTALVDWDKGFLFIGRGGAGDGTVIFENAKLTSASESKSYGIHVSGREKDTTNKYNGTLIINNSTIELDYLINKGNITLENSTLTVKNGFSIGGRPAVETESGEDATATINLTNSSKLVVNNHNGMGLGYEAIGIMNVTEGSTFECTQSFLITAKGTLNVDGGSVIIAGTLTNLGVNTTFKDATVKINKLNNGAALFIEGENTIQIEDISGSSYAIRAKDGVIFNDSYMPGTSNETLRLLGSATFNGGFKCAYLQGAGASQDGIGGTVTIEDGTVIEVSYGVEFSSDYLLNGGSIKLSGGNASGGIWGFVFQNSNFEINTDISVDGGESYAPIHFTDAVATINSSITQVNSHGEPLYIDDASVVTLGSNALINTLSVHGAGKLILDVTGMTDGEYANVKCSASGFTGTLETVGNDILSAEIVEGKIVLVDISVAKIGDKLFASIQAAVDAAAAGDVIVLTKDVVLTEGVVIAKDDSITLDLAGKTISMNDASGKTAYAIRNNGTLTVKDSVGNGTIVFETSTPSMSNSYASNAISNYGTITIESGTIKNNSVGGACYALDNYAGSTATINGGKLMAVKSTVRIFNWTDGDASKATLTVNGGEIISDLGYAITFNMGNTPAAELNINGGTVTTNDPNYNLAVYIISKGDAKNLAIKVTDGTFNGYFALNGVTSTTMADGNISIEGGKFDGVICYGEPAFGFVSGGSFVVKPEANVCAEGCAFAENADGGFGIVEAKVTLNGYGFASFEEALEAANDGDTIALLDDVSFDEVLVLDKAITISANGKAITAAIKVSANVVIDNAVINGVAGNVAVITITGDAKLTVQGGKIVAAKAMSARSGSALSTDNQYILLAEGTNGASAYLDTELDYADKNIFIGDANTITVSVKEAYKADLAARGFVAGEADGNGMVAISGSVPYYIGENGNWFFNGEDTGKKAIGTDGNNFTIGSDGYWYLNGEITEYKAVAKDADQYTIGDDGYWYLNGSKTEFKALGTDGKNYTIGSDGYWYLNGEITEHKAVGTDGDKVEIRDDGYWYINNVKTEYKAVGEPGQTPQFKIEDGNLKASFDGVAWEDLGPVVAAKPIFKIEDGVLKLSYDNVNWEPLGTVAGEAGSKITIEKVGDNYYWHIDDVNTDIKAEGVDGTKVTLEKVDGVYYWHIDGVNSGVKAEGIDGAAGTKVTLQKVDGVYYWHIDGVNSGVKAEGIDGAAGSKITLKPIDGVYYWHIDGVNSGVKAEGIDGAAGTKVTLKQVDGVFYWFLDGVNSGVKAEGVDGSAPTISEDGFWVIGGVETSYSAVGKDGKNYTIGEDGYWYCDGVKTEYRAIGVDGKTPTFKIDAGNLYVSYDNGENWTNLGRVVGEDGKTPYIGENGNWWIGDTDTEVPAQGQDGKAPFIGENGNWWIGDKDTGISATGNSDSDMKEIIMLCIGMAILCVITILVAIITRKSRSRWWVLS